MINNKVLKLTEYPIKMDLKNYIRCFNQFFSKCSEILQLDQLNQNNQLLFYMRLSVRYIYLFNILLALN